MLVGRVEVYRSIPYAVPPVGNLRWKPPQQLELPRCWNGTLDATSFRAVCMQSPPQTSASMDEDCLTLTVWTPRSAAAAAATTIRGPAADHNADARTCRASPASPLLPTIVFFHGGDLMFGANSFYNFSALVETSEAVVVAVNYRLSVWGWLAAAELRSADPRGVSGNYGLLDMQEALRWVRRNVRAFCGDASRVTVLGQSSGGTAVLALLASPASRGLFSRAIALSGSPNVTMGLSRAEAAGAAVVRELGCAPSAGHDSSMVVDEDTSLAAGLACLLSKNASELAVAVPQRWLNMDSFAFPGLAQQAGYHEHGVLIVDGVTVKAGLEDAFAGRIGGRLLGLGMDDVPLMIGTCAQEVEMCPSYDFTSRSGGGGGSVHSSGKNNTNTNTTFAAILQDTIGAAYGEAVLGGVRRTYQTQIEASSQLAYASMVSDLRFTCGNLALARILAESRSAKASSEGPHARTRGARAGTRGRMGGGGVEDRRSTGSGIGSGAEDKLSSTTAAMVDSGPVRPAGSMGQVAVAPSSSSSSVAAAAPVYSYLVEYNASKRWPTLACPEYGQSGRQGHLSAWAFHKIDLLAALGQWDFFRDYGNAAHGFSPPAAPDLAFGLQLRRLWLEFARTGRLDSTPWKPALPAQASTTKGFATINVARLGGAAGVVTVPGYKGDVCEFWAANRFDERFWLCN